jgi:acetyl-CoA carboxylase biotin carboxyl carrier protein
MSDEKPKGPPRGKSMPDRELIESVWEQARDLIKKLEGSSVQRLNVEAGDYKIEIERGGGGPVAGPAPAPMAAPAGAAAVGDGAAEAAEMDGRHTVIAPLVGTFYRASQPGAKPFVEEGDVVDEGQTVAIVEAMKLMNQVKADQAGRVAEIVATDGEWVEFEQVLMYLEPVEE